MPSEPRSRQSSRPQPPKWPLAAGSGRFRAPKSPPTPPVPRSKGCPKIRRAVHPMRCRRNSRRPWSCFQVKTSTDAKHFPHHIMHASYVCMRLCLYMIHLLDILYTSYTVYRIQYTVHKLIVTPGTQLDHVKPRCSCLPSMHSPPPPRTTCASESPWSSAPPRSPWCHVVYTANGINIEIIECNIIYI